MSQIDFDFFLTMAKAMMNEDVRRWDWHLSYFASTTGMLMKAGQDLLPCFVFFFNDQCMLQIPSGDIKIIFKKILSCSNVIKSNGTLSMYKIIIHLSVDRVYWKLTFWYNVFLHQYRLSLSVSLLCVLVCLFVFLTSSSEHLAILRAATHETELGDHDSVSAGHIILTPTQPVGSGRPQRESNLGPPHQESRSLPTELLRPSYYVCSEPY